MIRILCWLGTHDWYLINGTNTACNTFQCIRCKKVKLVPLVLMSDLNDGG